MMFFNWIISFVLIRPTVMELLQDSVAFSIAYFKEKDISSVCVIDCENKLFWIKSLAKCASNNSIAISSFNTKKRGWRDDMIECISMSQRNKMLKTMGILLQASCENIEEILGLASLNMWFNAQRSWLILDDGTNTVLDKNIENRSLNYNIFETNESNVIKILDNLNISVDADIMVGQKTDQFQYNLFDIFNFGKIQGGTLRIEDFGSWSLDSGFTARLNENKYFRRWNYQGWKMRTVIVSTIPPEKFDTELLMTDEPIPGISRIMKITIHVIKALATEHNITLVYSLTDRWYSHFERNNTKVAANALYFRLQDISPALRLAKDYTDKIDFVNIPLCVISSKYYYRILTIGPGKFENPFLRPFSTSIWLCSLAVAAVIMVIVVPAARMEKRPNEVQYALFSVIANLCQMEFEDDFRNAKSVTIRVTTFVTGLCCVMIYNYYTSSVVAWLLNAPPPSIRNLEELKDSPLELIYEDMGYTRSWLANPGVYYYNRKNTIIEDKMRKKLLSKNKNWETLFKPQHEGIAMVKAGGYAYHCEVDAADYLIGKRFSNAEQCEVGSLISLDKVKISPGLQKNSPYKEFFNFRLTRFLEVGIINNEDRRISVPPITCDGRSPRALALGGAAPAFIMLAFGYLIGTVIMLVERCISRRQMNDLSYPFLP